MRAATIAALRSAAADAGAYPILAQIAADGMLNTGTVSPLEPRDQNSPFAAGKDNGPGRAALAAVYVFTPGGSVTLNAYDMGAARDGEITLAVTMLVAESDGDSAEDRLDDLETEVQTALASDGDWRREVYLHLSEDTEIETIYDIAEEGLAAVEATMMMAVARADCWPLTLPTGGVSLDKFTEPVTDSPQGGTEPDFRLTQTELAP